MAPAFSSTRQAAAFTLLLLLLLLLPVIAGKSVLPPREEIYSTLGWRYGPYHYLHRQIFEEKGDVDIAIIGSSRVLHGLDTPYVQKQLSEALGRKATVITLGYSWAGFDALYFITKDLLQNRQVRLIVFAEECRGSDNPHHAAPYLFRFADDRSALESLPFPQRAAYYFGAILGMPRNLLGLFRSNYPGQSPEAAGAWQRDLRAPDPAERLGAAYARLGFDHAPAKFVEYQPAARAQPSDVRTYSPATRDLFQFQGPPAPPLQLHFARRFAALARGDGSKLLCLHFPEINEIRALVIQERELWPEALGTDVTVAGIPPAKLFEGLADEEVLKLFLDPYHFNKNGQDYFTPLVTPTLIQTCIDRHEP